MSTSRKKTSSKPKRHWEEIAREAQEYRDASIRNVPGINEVSARIEGLELLPKCSINLPSNILRPKDIQITESLPEELVVSLGRGEISAVEVTTAFLRRAALAQGLVSFFSAPYILPYLVLIDSRQIASQSFFPREL